MKTLDHRTFLSRHQSTGLGTGDAQRVLRVQRIEPKH
jgi:hypothetical protein